MFAIAATHTPTGQARAIASAAAIATGAKPRLVMAVNSARQCANKVTFPTLRARGRERARAVPEEEPGREQEREREREGGAVRERRDRSRGAASDAAREADRWACCSEVVEELCRPAHAWALLLSLKAMQQAGARQGR